MEPEEWQRRGEGHRQRLRDKFLAQGIEAFTDAEIIELLLTFGTPRPDCKEAARALLAQFGSLPAVLDALPAPWRARLAGALDIPAVFARMEQAGAEYALHVLRSAAPPLARAFSYLILRERDLRALRAVLRGRRLGLGVAAVRLALQRSPESLH